jgi:arylformamidase
MGRIVELSHRLVPGEEEFKLEIETFNAEEITPWIQRRPDLWYIIQDVKMSSHLGTHIEFPYHHLKKGKSAAEYPVDRIIGEAVVLDFSHKKKDEEITRAEIVSSGADIHTGDILFIRTDMDKLWKTEKGHDRPCLSIDATRYLVEECTIHCIGTDATGLEVRGRDDQPVHQLLFTHNVAVVESLTNLDKIESTRFFVFILPLMIVGLDSCPVRVVAFDRK